MGSRLAAIGWATAMALGLFALLSTTDAHARGQQLPGLQACCTVTAIDSTAGIVTTRDNQTGRIFQFRVTDRGLLATVRVGQPVYADFGTNQVSLTAGTPCCPIVASGTSPRPQPTPGTAARPQTTPGGVPSVPPAQPLTKETKPAAPSQGMTTISPSVMQNVLGWFGQHGGRFHASADPTRPAILLVHGVHNNAFTWTRPADDPGVDGFYYDHRHEPPSVKLENQYPPVGIYKKGTSSRFRDQINALNWFDYLVSQNFTVATWSQPGETFNDAYPSAEQAYEQFVNATSGPIALVGYSRGGLLVRALLKEKVLKQQIGLGRLRWVITLHSPHAGSELARGVPVLLEEVGLKCRQVPVVPNEIPIPSDWFPKVSDMCQELLDHLSRYLARPGSLEMAPDGPVVGAIRQGETPVPGVSYFTFGGTSPTYIRYYLWFFTVGSQIPQYKCDPAPTNCKQYFKWEAVPKQITTMSPMYDVVRDFVPEIKPGFGDGLVADARARLPFATHTTTALNHAEVLWNRPLQARVVQLLSGTLSPKTGRP